jgi:hypothetical protein
MVPPEQQTQEAAEVALLVKEPGIRQAVMVARVS